MKTYRVWFEKVNQEYYDVNTNDGEKAGEEAIEIWKRRNGQPLITLIDKILTNEKGSAVCIDERGRTQDEI